MRDLICHSYLVAVLQGTNNPHYSQIAKDVRDAILRKPAGNGELAKYWTKEQQEVKIEAAYTKWAAKGAWLAAAQNVSYQFPTISTRHKINYRL